MEEQPAQATGWSCPEPELGQGEQGGGEGVLGPGGAPEEKIREQEGAQAGERSRTGEGDPWTSTKGGWV